MFRPPSTRNDRPFVSYFDRVALPASGIRIPHRGRREIWRLWLLQGRAGEL